MLAAIISDTHDNLTNLREFFVSIKNLNVKLILHCGDLCFLPTLLKMKGLFSGEIYLVKGNCDEELEKKKIPENVFFFKEIGEVKIGEKKIAFCHCPKKAKKLAKEEKYDFVFHGHTHYPWQEKIKKTLVCNPGNLAGTFFPPSFVLWDLKNNKLKLKRLY